MDAFGWDGRVVSLGEHNSGRCAYLCLLRGLNNSSKYIVCVCAVYASVSMADVEISSELHVMGHDQTLMPSHDHAEHPRFNSKLVLIVNPSIATQIPILWADLTILLVLECFARNSRPDTS